MSCKKLQHCFEKGNAWFIPPLPFIFAHPCKYKLRYEIARAILIMMIPVYFAEAIFGMIQVTKLLLQFIYISVPYETSR